MTTRCGSSSCRATAVMRVTFKASASGEALLCAGCVLRYERHIAARVSVAGEQWIDPARAATATTAAAAAGRVQAGTQRSKALAALADAGERGLTDYELSLRIGHPRPHVAGTRRKELFDLGLVEASLETRPTDTGSPAQVWRINAAGAGEALRITRRAS